MSGAFNCLWRCIGILLLALVAACSNSDDESGSGLLSGQVVPNTDALQATVRRTTNGVPHINADSLEAVAFANGYSQAQDNVCQLAESFVKARSERALYFGPGPDNIHVINDFSYQALRIYSGAIDELPALSQESRALLDGFVAGYNLYVTETASENLPPQCRNQPWVRSIAVPDLLAHYRLMAQYASGDFFAYGGVFSAVPPGVSVEPRVVGNQSRVPSSIDSARLTRDIAADAIRSAGLPQDFTDTGSGSNAWGIGTTFTENGRGALLANPHFPYTGARRMYQSHLIVPDYLNVNGAGLLGIAVPLIGFNQNLAWSHTVSTSVRFTSYELTLQEGDPLSYVKDGETRPITSETLQVQVGNGTSQPTLLEREFYFSEYGPMLPGDLLTGGALPTWGDENRAYTFRDANASVVTLLDTWLGMGRASTLDEFQQVFRDCGSTLWVNTVYADEQGNAFYIDSSSVPNLSADALAAIAIKRQQSEVYEAFIRDGFVLLDGNTSRDDWVESACGPLVPYEDKPKLLRNDFVQNANDSPWATNPLTPLTGYSAMFGSEANQLSSRTRMGLRMLQEPDQTGFALSAPAGQDGKFNAQELIQTLYNNRAFHAETLLEELRARCDLAGTLSINTAAGAPRSVGDACATLQGWNGTFDSDSVGAHVFRLFMINYLQVIDQDLSVPFDPIDPVNTPSTPSSDNRGTASDTMLMALAMAANTIESAGVPYSATLGSLQVYQQSGDAPPGGEAVVQGSLLPWHGSISFIEGGFNAIAVTNTDVHEDTRFPRLVSETIPGTAGLSSVPGDYWRIGRGTSWHFGLEFSDEGPIAYGLMSYSQSTDSRSPYFSDQSERYSNKDYRPLLFSEESIAANVLPGGTRVLEGIRLSTQ